MKSNDTRTPYQKLMHFISTIIIIIAFFVIALIAMNFNLFCSMFMRNNALSIADYLNTFWAFILRALGLS